MNKVIAVLVLLLVTHTAVFFVGRSNGIGTEVKKELNAVGDKVENHNEDVKEINETVRIVEKIIYRDKETVMRIPSVDASEPCPIGELVRVRNQSYQALNPSLFERTD